jgi:hypothetical protein
VEAFENNISKLFYLEILGKLHYKIEEFICSNPLFVQKARLCKELISAKNSFVLKLICPNPSFAQKTHFPNQNKNIYTLQ